MTEVEKIKSEFRRIDIPKDKIGIWSGLQRRNKRHGKWENIGAISGGYFKVQCKYKGKWKAREVHRIIAVLETGKFPRMVDHKDRNSLNNNIDNLDFNSNGTKNSLNRCNTKKLPYVTRGKRLVRGWNKGKYPYTILVISPYFNKRVYSKKEAKMWSAILVRYMSKRPGNSRDQVRVPKSA